MRCFRCDQEIGGYHKTINHKDFCGDCLTDRLGNLNYSIKCEANDEMRELALFGFKKLQMRFNKIDNDKYLCSYSGGSDSHLVVWYIKMLRLSVKIASINTYREHKEVRQRMYAYADVVLYPDKPFDWIYEQYGEPCFSKQQDEYIERYQGGSRTKNTMKAINGGEGSKFQLNKTAKRLTLSGEIHKVSNKCCKYTKKVPLINYQKEHDLLPLICVRGAESATRNAKYQTCLKQTGEFTPIFDFSTQVVNAMYEYFGISTLDVYKYIDRTGCIGCPYGIGSGNTEKELFLVTDQQREFAIESFKKAYDIRGVDYKNEQIKLDL